MMNILVNGSLAIDRIMQFEDQFKIKLFLDDKCGCHLNEKGHEIVADLIYQNFNFLKI